MIILKTILKSKSYENASLDDLLTFREDYSLTIRFPQEKQPEMSINCYPTFYIYNVQEIQILSLEKMISNLPENIKQLYLKWKTNQKLVKQYVFHIFYAMNRKYNPLAKESSNNRIDRIPSQFNIHIIFIECISFANNLLYINENLISEMFSFILFDHNETLQTDTVKITKELQNVISKQENFLKIVIQCIQVLESE